MRFSGFAASLESRGQAGCAPAKCSPSTPPIWIPELPILWARQLSAAEEVPHAKCPSRPSAAQAAGLRYEAKAIASLEATYRSVPHLVRPWMVYCDSRARRHYCQPDFVADLGNLLLCVEIKARWTPSAWWQLRRLYEPVLAEAFKLPVLSIVLCSSYDPAIPPPEEVNFLTAPPQSGVLGFPVLIWRA